MQQQGKQQNNFLQFNSGQSIPNSDSTFQHQSSQQITTSNPLLQQQSIQHVEISQTPQQSPNRSGTLISSNILHNPNSLNQMIQNGQIPGIPNLQQQSSMGSTGFHTSTQRTSQGQLNLPSTPGNKLPSNQYIPLQKNPSKVYQNQNQLESQQSKQIKNNQTFTSLTTKIELEKSASMDRQNLAMRIKLQQNQKRKQLDEKNQVFTAIKENNLHEIEDLLNQFNSLSLESKDEEGNTFIIIAAQVGSKEIVDYLFQKGADIDAQNNDGDTALHYANFYKYHHVADYLIQSGAQQNKMNNFGINPWGCYISLSNK